MEFFFARAQGGTAQGGTQKSLIQEYMPLNPIGILTEFFIMI